MLNRKAIELTNKIYKIKRRIEKGFRLFLCYLVYPLTLYQKPQWG